jgi:hypothetical protein
MQSTETKYDASQVCEMVEDRCLFESKDVVYSLGMEVDESGYNRLNWRNRLPVERIMRSHDGENTSDMTLPRNQFARNGRARPSQD